MNIELKKIKIRDLFEGYLNDLEDGVVGLGGKLNIRPKYQREYVYKDKQRDDVIRTIRKGFPLNTMYYVKNEDDTFELLDGQQRSISICEYIEGNFSIDYQYFFNLEEDEQNQILDYELMVYVCEGTDKERLDWFEVINIAGVKLTKQELRNAVYTGAWLSDAKRYFSKTNCPAYGLANKLVKGVAIQQAYLETAIKWISNDNIEEYMSDHQHDDNAQELWLYFQNVISWVNTKFPNYRKEMQGVDWGYLYNNFKDVNVDADRVTELMKDDEVTKRSGIYSFLLTGEEKYLSIRAFTDNQKRIKFEEQNGVCPHTGKKFEDYNQMDADHITPWSKGGKTDLDNLQMVCPKWNKQKGNKG